MTEAQTKPGATPWLLGAWVFLLAGIALLWTVGRLLQPRAEFFAILLGVGILGGGACIVSGLLGFKSRSAVFSILNILAGAAGCASAAFFVLGVLSNEDSRIDVAGPKPTWPDVLVRRFRILNLNVLHGYPDFDQQENRFLDTVKELKQHDAHIIVLQESWFTKRHGNMAERLSRELGFNYVYARANGSWNHLGFEEGSAILSRFPIVEAQRIVLRPKEPWWENRIALVAKLDVPGHGALTVVGVHLGLTTPDQQAVHLLDITEQFSPDIIAGDLNALPGSNALRAFADHAFVEAMPMNKSDLPWIDHVFFSPRFRASWDAEARWIIAAKPIDGMRDAISDHDGIVVDCWRR